MDVTTLAERVDAIAWYHTFDLPGGITTPGLYDHREVVHRLPLPADLSGRRCLDLASSDGFFAFEMARRGAAEVVSVDLDDQTQSDFQGDPPEETRALGTGRANQAFGIVREATGLDVQRLDLNLYDVAPEAVGGVFDVVFMGNVLLHVRDPHLVLERVRSVTAGRFLSFEMINLALTLSRPLTPTASLWEGDHARWWTPNVAAHRRMLRASGFEVLAGRWPLFQPFGELYPRWPKRLPRRRKELVYWAWQRRVGAASTWSLCRPAR